MFNDDAKHCSNCGRDLIGLSPLLLNGRPLCQACFHDQIAPREESEYLDDDLLRDYGGEG
jgi:hypothetical protein